MTITREQLVRYQKAIAKKADELRIAVEESLRKYRALEFEYDLHRDQKEALILVLRNWPEDRPIMIPEELERRILCSQHADQVKE